MTEQDDLLPQEMLQMLVVAREGLSPQDKDVARVRSSLSAALLVRGGGEALLDNDALPGGGALSESGALGSSSSGLGAAGGLTTGVKLVLFGLSIGVGASVGAKLLSQPEESAQALSQSPPPEASSSRSSQPTLLAEPSVDLPTPERLPSAAERSARVDAPLTGTTASNQRGPADVSEMPAELALVTRARRAVNQGEGELALGILRELDEKHPRGMLLEERRATEILAHCANHNRARAEASARRFHATWPNSVYGDRVAQSCARKEEISQTVDGSTEGRTPTQE